MLTLVMLASAARVEADHDTRTITGGTEMSTPKETGGHAARCAWLADGEASQGLFGHMIPLQGSEGDGFHTLRLSRAVRDSFYNPGPDFDIYFYRTLGTCTAEADRTGASVWSDDSDEFDERIPTGTRFALVVLAGPIDTPRSCYYGGLLVCGGPSPLAADSGPQGFTATIFPNPVWDWSA